jgi:hypothetical protein
MDATMAFLEIIPKARAFTWTEDVRILFKAHIGSEEIVTKTNVLFDIGKGA